MSCITPSGDEWELVYESEESKYCVRMRRNGMEYFDLTLNTAKYTEMLKDATTYSSDELIIEVNLEIDACMNLANDLSLGLFDEDNGKCIKDGVVTAYTKFKAPQWKNIDSFVTAKASTLLFYSVQAGDDKCWTRDAGIDDCTASIFYDHSSDYPEIAFKCACTGQADVIEHYSNKGTELILFGDFKSRFTSDDFYMSL